jgi:hypothetical protein
MRDKIQYSNFSFTFRDLNSSITINMFGFVFSHDDNWTTIYFDAGKDKWSCNTQGCIKKYQISTYGYSSLDNPIEIYMSIDSAEDRKEFDLCFEQFISDIKESGEIKQ